MSSFRTQAAAKGESPRAVRNSPKRREEFLGVLTARGVELAWPKPRVARSYNSVYAEVEGWYFGETELKK